MNYPLPWSVQIELTEGCTRRCPMCGIHSTRWDKNHFKFIEPEVVLRVANELNKWIPQGRRIEFALQGEPLANPNVANIISIFRAYYPKSQLLISTNGDLITADLIEKLFVNGLNTLLVNCYDDNTRSDILKIAMRSNPKGIPIFDFYEEPKPKVYSYRGYQHQEIIFIDSVLDREGESPIRKLNNQAGYGKMRYGGRILPLKASCSNVFRELVIKYDGTIMACCMDWLRKMPVGKFPEQSLKEIWEGDRFNKIRRSLYNYDRSNLELCSNCDYVGFKNGIARHDWKHVFEERNS